MVMEIEGTSLTASTAVNGGGDDASKTSAGRLPRWTRAEILVLIEGKKAAESRVRRGRVGSGLEFGSGQIEPKWASVSSYCKKQGVNRGPVQCRKRWSNLAGDFKKIKEWESKIGDEAESSFWVMRNDLRRERKLPGFFDREVYDILDGGVVVGGGGGGNLALALGPSISDEPKPETLFDSGRSGAADDGLFSDFEQEEEKEKDGLFPATEAVELTPTSIPAPVPISEQQYEPFPQDTPAQGTSHEKQPAQEPDIASAQESGRKRKRDATDATDEESVNLQHQLVKVLESNGKLLSSQLEAQNVHLQLDREQRNDHVNSLIAVLNKLSDALGRIADKL